MKVLLTGASGFVGSHILDQLVARGIPAAILLRPTSSRRFLETLLPRVEVRPGSISDPATLPAALEGVTHIVHCAGCTKALRTSEYYQVNRDGTRNLVEAVNSAKGGFQRFILISSLAASHPAVGSAPAKEDDPPAPVTDYGRSKLAAEAEVSDRLRAPFVVLRPSAVYGPRDADFLLVFKGARAPLIPSFGGGRQELSLVFVEDVARAALACLDHPAAAGRIYNVAHPEVTSAGQLTSEIARQLGRKPLQVPLPMPLLWPVCGLSEIWGRVTGRAGILSRQKYPELKASGWVCDTRRLREELGFEAATGLKNGIARTLAWYRAEGWLS